MKLKSFALLALTSFVVISCSEDFDATAKWKDITIVYGLLNPNSADSVNYIKISRAFLNPETSASDIASGSIDSLYYTDSLSVVIEPWRNGNHIAGDIVFYKEYNENKDTDGVFYAPGQYIYRTKKGIVLDPNARYKLKIINIATGKEITSESSIVGNLIQQRPLPGGAIHFDTSGKTLLEWLPGKNAYFYNIDIKFRFWEYREGHPEERQMKEIKWRVISSYLNPGIDNKPMELKIEGKNFYKFITDKLDINTGIVRELPQYHVEVEFSAGAKELYYYINVNQPAVGLVQKKPEYSNITNGIGVFSSRNINSFNTELSTIAKDYLFNSDEMINYNFTE